jgi:hypothetical protein
VFVSLFKPLCGIFKLFILFMQYFNWSNLDQQGWWLNYASFHSYQEKMMISFKTWYSFAITNSSFFNFVLSLNNNLFHRHINVLFLIQGNIIRLNKNSKIVKIAWRKDLNYWEEQRNRGQRKFYFQSSMEISVCPVHVFSRTVLSSYVSVSHQ